MIVRYKKTIISLLDKLHLARQNPYHCTDLWLDIQESLLKKQLYIENIYRRQKAEITEQNKIRKNPKDRKTKEESLLIKEKIKRSEELIEEYTFLINIFKSIGDGIAFTFLDKLDIKPQNFKESPGFISMKSGLSNEIKALRYALNNKTIAILHDLTSVLKYADLTIIREGIRPMAIEMKSSSIVNSRIVRQEKKARNVYKYLTEDKTDSLYGKDGEMVRLSLLSPEINYINELNLLLDEAEIHGTAYKLMEEGLLYIVSYRHFSPDQYEKAFVQNSITNPISYILNKFDIVGQGYYPLSLGFKKTHHYWEFINERVSILIACELSIIEKLASNAGYNVNISESTDYIFSFQSNDEKTSGIEFNISRHFFGRVFYEFVSLAWLFTDTFERLEALKNKKLPLIE